MLHALRFWLRRPVQATWLAIIIGLAVGGAAAVVVVARGLVWKQLPFKDPDSLVVVQPTDRNGDVGAGMWAEEYVAWQEHQRVFSSLGAYQFGFPATIEVTDHVEPVSSLWVTTSFFEVLGALPEKGRLFTLTDVPNGQDEVAILGNHAWHAWFGGDPTVLGRRVQMATGGERWSATIIGVLPEGADVQGSYASGVDLFLPMTDGPLPLAARTRGWNTRTILARLPDGMMLEDAAHRATDLVPVIALDAPANPRRAGVRVTRLREDLYGRNRPFALLLLVAGALVVAVASTNAAGIVLALANRRTQEFRVRLALGASRRDLARLVLAEAVSVAVVSVVAAIIAMSSVVTTLVTLAPPDIRGLSAVSVSWPETVAGGAMAGAAVLLIYLIFMRVRPRRDLHGVLHASQVATVPRSALKARSVLLTAQLAIVLALVVGAGVMTSTLWRLAHQPLGFEAGGVITAEIGITGRYSSDAPRYQQLLHDLRDTALASGSPQTAVSFEAPLASSTGGGAIAVGMPDGRRRSARHNMVSDGFFGVLQIPVLAGRDFGSADYVSGRFAVVNRAFAEAYLGGISSAVGQSVTFGRDKGAEIVGVVGDVRDVELVKPIEPAVYSLLTTMMWTPSRVFLLAREPAHGQVSGVLSRAVRSVDHQLTVRESNLSDRFRDQTARTRMQATLLALLAMFTMLLAALGIYALVSQLTNDRMRELGIRAALGAAPGRLIALILHAVAVPTIVGVLIGLGVSWALVRLLHQFLFNTSPFDLVSWVGAVLILTASVLGAAWLPARRAGLLSPAAVLRRE